MEASLRSLLKELEMKENKDFIDFTDSLKALFEKYGIDPSQVPAFSMFFEEFTKR